MANKISDATGKVSHNSHLTPDVTLCPPGRNSRLMSQRSGQTLEQLSKKQNDNKGNRND